MLAWEAEHVDAAVADVFGFHALQLGLPQLDALAANRMPHRWIATETVSTAHDGPMARGAAVALHCDFDALPFDSASIDLVVLPHALELARDPHLALREVERVLRPEGRVVIVGFNPASLWGLRQRFGVVRRRLAVGVEQGPFLPETSELIAVRRLRDWLHLLSFDIETGRFGCYRPPFGSERWAQRFGWMEHAGDRWWPMFGAVYLLTAVKRVRGMRLIGLARRKTQFASAAPSPIAAKQSHRREERSDAA